MAAAVKLLVLALTLQSAFWAPAAAITRCPGRAADNSSHGEEVRHAARTPELPPGCTEEDMGEEEEEFDSAVHIARLEFHRVETIFTILVFIMVVVLAKMGELYLEPHSLSYKVAVNPCHSAPATPCS
jgi:hypothetical protein